MARVAVTQEVFDAVVDNGPMVLLPRPISVAITTSVFRVIDDRDARQHEAIDPLTPRR